MGQARRKLLTGTWDPAWPRLPREPGQDQLTEVGGHQAPERS
jgi:hypothetical protein